MAKIDRLGWADGITFSAHGVRVGIRVSSPETLDAVAPRLPPGWKPARSPVVDQLYSLIDGGEPRRGLRRYNILYWGNSRLARRLDREEVLEALESELRQVVAIRSPQRVFLHAGVVAWRGRAILIPGRSYSGKSTLTAELVKAGATYYSDEFAVVDAQGRIHPFAKPLALRREDGVDKVTAESLGGSSGVRPLRAGLVVLTRFEEGKRWRPTRVSPGRGLLELLAHAAPTRLRPGETMEALSRMIDGATLLKGARGEAADVARAVLKSVEETGTGRANAAGGRS